MAIADVAYLFITDMKKAIAKKLRHKSPSQLLQVEGVIDFARKSYDGMAEVSVQCALRIPLVVIVKVESLDAQKDAVPLSQLSLDSDLVEDAFFAFLSPDNKVEKMPVMEIEGQPAQEITDDNLWKSLAYLSSARSSGKTITLSFKKYERLDSTYLPNLSQVFNELKDKYYPTTDSPLFKVVPSSAPFLACTRTEGDEIVIDISEAALAKPGLLRQALAHELIHWRIFREKLDVANHGETFHKYADEINAVEGANYVTVYADDLC